MTDRFFTTFYPLAAPRFTPFLLIQTLVRTRLRLYTVAAIGGFRAVFVFAQALFSARARHSAQLGSFLYMRARPWNTFQVSMYTRELGTKELTDTAREEVLYQARPARKGRKSLES
jgi:hypothetical protein